MMPLVAFGWNVVVFILCLAGFFFLVFANEREGRRLLHRPASRRERRICAGAGGVLLLLALWVCIQEWRGNFGSVLWFGWLTALAVIFTTSGDGRSGDGKQKSGNRKARHCEERSDVAIQAAIPLPETLGQIESSSGLPRAYGPRNDENRVSWEFMKRMAIRGAFVFLPCLFLLSGWRVEPWPVLRTGAVQGTVGPWQFTLAETETAAPKVGGSGVAMKEFELRFADDAQTKIRAAYLRARKPRSLRAAGIAFEGNHLRTATIIIPPAFQAEEQIWLTVEGRNGEVHHAAAKIREGRDSLSWRQSSAFRDTLAANPPGNPGRSEVARGGCGSIFPPALRQNASTRFNHHDFPHGGQVVHRHSAQNQSRRRDPLFHEPRLPQVSPSGQPSHDGFFRQCALAFVTTRAWKLL
jgi:hypothetical protein